MGILKSFFWHFHHKIFLNNIPTPPLSLPDSLFTNYQLNYICRLTMKYTLLLPFLFFVIVSNAQSITSKVDTSNYYNLMVHFNKNSNGFVYASNLGETKSAVNIKLKGRTMTTGWLRENEAVPVIMEEMKKAGYNNLFDHSLFKTNSGQQLILSVYSYKPKFGILYIQGHMAIPQQKHRKEKNFTRFNQDYDYSQREETESGEANFIKIEKLPKNILVLSENVYWYQMTDNADDNKVLFSKERAIEILRQDIQSTLSAAPKPIKSNPQIFIIKEPN